MIRIMVENKRAGTDITDKPKRVRISYGVDSHQLILMLNYFEWLEDPPDGLKRWITVNGAILTREQIYSQPRYDAYEWAELLLADLALKAVKRRAAAKQDRADLASGINNALRFGL